jgi:hypothetical protein
MDEEWEKRIKDELHRKSAVQLADALKRAAENIKWFSRMQTLIKLEQILREKRG